MARTRDYCQQAPPPPPNNSHNITPTPTTPTTPPETQAASRASTPPAILCSYQIDWLALGFDVHAIEGFLFVLNFKCQSSHHTALLAPQWCPICRPPRSKG